MKILSRLFGKRIQKKQVNARFDAAQTTPENRRHWSFTDQLSADAEASPQVRKILRSRSRYEVANNSYARGMVRTLADDVVGTGPKLQLLSESDETNRFVEREFLRWAKSIDLAGKLHTMRQGMTQDGESFAVMVSNSKLDTEVKLDLRLVEADQVTSPLGTIDSPLVVDGIVFDEIGNPIEYLVLKNHPGSNSSSSMSFDRIRADAVLHLFRVNRAGQHRGVPELTPALPLFAQLRRYTLAVLGAAETAADFAGVIFTDSPVNGEAEPLEPMDQIELEKRMLVTMPGGWKIGQIKSEQPTTTYKDFKREILNEIARALNMPFNIAAGNSSEYNYSSGRLDHQTYFKSIRIDQNHINTHVMDRIFKAWIDEAVLIEGYLPQELRNTDSNISHNWFWDGNDHVDPQRESNAQATRLQNNTTTLADEYARQGKDWEAQIRQRAREIELLRELNIENTQPNFSDAEIEIEEEQTT